MVSHVSGINLEVTAEIRVLLLKRQNNISDKNKLLSPANEVVKR